MKYKFRAKSTKTGKWVYCDLFSSFNEEIDKSTIGQFINLYDSNGAEVYEGDIVEDIETVERYTVFFSTDGVGSCGCCYEEFTGSGFIIKGLCKTDDTVIIGNIYDNPYLIK